MTRPTRTRLRGAELEEAILEAAESCFERFGIAKTTMDDVARVADISRATVYRYFADRESLILASIRRRARMNLAPARAFIAGFPDFADKLTEGICHNVRRGRRDPMVHLLVSPDEMPLATSLLGATGVAVELTHELWEPILREAQEAGQLRADVELRELSEWISHLEIMFISQFDRDDASLDRFRHMIRQFLVPAVAS
ncbi:TetR/AcrR family transcriptional regulator [Actinomadura nitritigenes]|uniref:TetR/AcrR family transcriptional regulator n=1 Tax=Actinomadura nitritigenes TaxID=134602 RepID=UPI003D93A747